MLKPLRILIIDDSPDDAQLILHTLRRSGYRPVYKRVDTAGTLTAVLGEKGWEWNVVPCDYAMPGFSGLAALPILRALAPGTPIIAVSGHAGQVRRGAIMRAGVSVFIDKSCLDELPRAIADVLSRD